jgi:hypothetical protein
LPGLESAVEGLSDGGVEGVDRAVALGHFVRIVSPTRIFTVASVSVAVRVVSTFTW